MKEWTKREVIEKLNDGWILTGDIASDAPFGLIDRYYQEPGLNWFPMVPSALVRELADNGELIPDALPGKVISYRQAR